MKLNLLKALLIIIKEKSEEEKKEYMSRFFGNYN